MAAVREHTEPCAHCLMRISLRCYTRICGDGGRQNIMRAKEFVEQIQLGMGVPENLRNALPGLSARGPTLLASLIAQTQPPRNRGQMPGEVPRHILADIARGFHQRAGTLTPGVLDAISDLQLGFPIIRVAHQANLFSYLNIVAQPILLAWVNRELAQQAYPAVEVFILVDYDAGSDKRFGLSAYPDLDSRNGVLSMSARVPKSDRDILMCYVQKPSEEQISDWLMRIQEIMRRDLAAIGHIRCKRGARDAFARTFAELSELSRDAQARALTLADFNAIFLSKLVNSCWGLRTLFIPGHAVMSHLKPQMEYLLSQYPMIVEAVTRARAILETAGIEISQSVGPQPNVAPLWYICGTCHGRVALASKDDTLIGVGQCRKCGVEYQLLRAALRTGHNTFVPRIILDNLLEECGWGVMGGVGYIGASEHELVSGLAASILGWRVPIDLIWRTRGVYYGTAECRFATQAMVDKEDPRGVRRGTIKVIARGAASCLYYLLSQGLHGLADMWNDHWRHGGLVTDVAIGRTSNVELQESERHILASLATERERPGEPDVTQR
jgi:hypothetical protein